MESTLRILLILGLVLYSLSTIYGYIYQRVYTKTAIIGIVFVAVALLLAFFLKR